MAEYHHRYVINEPRIPFELEVLYEDERIIVVDKPHYLATMPRGMWYRETALMRLREAYGEPDIIPAHRLDRMTAGVLVFVRDRAFRGAYQMLFQERRAAKVYECLAPIAPIQGRYTNRPPMGETLLWRECREGLPAGHYAARRPRYGTVTQLEPPRPFPLIRRSHITKVKGIMTAFEESGTVNAETLIERDELFAPGIARYTLHPRTGKTHQLRVHMNSLGLPIVGDDFYPEVIACPFDDFSRPLQLVARTLEFTDPVTGEPCRFVSRVPLNLA